MGICLNPGSGRFQIARRPKIYVDKSGLIACLNDMIQTESRFVCVSRPRRFGKSMAANMISAYYDRTVDTETEFSGMDISQDASFRLHGGTYDVIQLNIQDFLSRTHDVDALLALLKKSVLWELLETYPDFRYFDETDLSRTMADIYARTKRPFVIVIDEWDCIFRECRERKDWQEKYLDFLRGWLKDKPYVSLAYMTGILPIKKYGTQSALSDFREYTMLDPSVYAPYVGFSEDEVRMLCERHAMDFAGTRRWYDGYDPPGVGPVYAPH